MAKKKTGSAGTRNVTQATYARDMAALNTRVGAVETGLTGAQTAVTGLATRVGAVETDLAQGLQYLQGDQNDLAKRVDAVEAGLTLAQANYTRDMGALTGRVTALEQRGVWSNLKGMYHAIGKVSRNVKIGVGVGVGALAIGLAAWASSGGSSPRDVVFDEEVNGIKVTYDEGDNHTLKIDDGHYRFTFENTEGARTSIKTATGRGAFKDDDVEKVTVYRPGKEVKFTEDGRFDGYGVPRDAFFGAANTCYNDAREAVRTRNSAALAEVVGRFTRIGTELGVATSAPASAGPSTTTAPATGTSK